jgi:hypothetical protein
MKGFSPPVPIEIQVRKPVLLSGPVIKFIPALAVLFNGGVHAIVYHQMAYLSRDTQVGEKCVKAKRISLTRLQRQLPFVSRRWLIKVLKDLEESEFVEVERTRGVNVYIPKFSIEELVNCPVQSIPKVYLSDYIVLPTLAHKIGLKEAIVLQQIHIRNHEQDGSVYVIRSLEQWHSQTFHFWGVATVKRIFRKLRNLNLLFVRPYRREDEGFVNSYRVNYIGVAEILGLLIPNVENPYDPNPKDSWDKNWQEWTNPVTQKKQIELH